MTVLQLPFDFRFVWGGAKLVFPFVRRGIVPECKSPPLNLPSADRKQEIINRVLFYSPAMATWFLPRLLGHSKATSLLLTGETVKPSSESIRDLYHKILPTREDVFPAALAFAHELAANTSQLSIAYTKGLLLHPGASVEENHVLDSRAIRLTGASADAVEGVKSFKERRPPRFPDTLSKNLSPWYPWVSTAFVLVNFLFNFL
jgi:Enoyl-CoA hydratase/isomerase